MLMDSMPRRLEEVIERQGASIKYLNPYKQKNMKNKMIFEKYFFL
jgi:hypothetical protein